MMTGRRAAVNVGNVAISISLLVAFVSMPNQGAAQRRNIDQQIRDDRARLIEIRQQRQDLESELRTT